MAKKQFIPAIFRTVRVLEWLADNPDGGSLSEIARSLGLPVSTTHETLSTLVALRVVDRPANSIRYSLGVRLLEIGMSYLSRTNLMQEFHTVAGRLSRQIGETVQLAVRDGRDVLYIAEVRGTQSVRVVTDAGRRLPCHTASTGKALLACLTDDETVQLYRNKPLIRMTRHSLDSLPALLAELDAIRRRGYAVDAQETYEGIQCIGSAVYGPAGVPAAGISVAMPYTVANVERVKEIAGAVCEAAAAISKGLGHASPFGVARKPASAADLSSVGGAGSERSPTAAVRRGRAGSSGG